MGFSLRSPEMNPAEIPLWIQATQWASRSILVLLVLLSIWSVATMIRCRRLLLAAAGDENRFQNLRQMIQDGKLQQILAGGSDQGLYEAVVKEAAKNSSQEPSR